MKTLVPGLAVWALLALASAESEPGGEPPQPPPALPENTTVTSRTKQFRISGGNQLGRGLCAILAENAKEELLQVMQQPDQWKIPISVVLHGEPGDKAPANRFVTRLKVVGGVYQLQLDMHLAQGLQVERFKRAVTEMLLYERSLKAQALMDDAISLSIPPWLSLGLREASAWQTQQSERRLYAAMFKQDGAFKVEDLLSVDRSDHAGFDEASEVAFRVSSGALVMALLEQPGGRDAFTKFLDEAASFQGEMALLLRRHFPELNLSPNSLAKWWALQMASQGGLQRLTDVMSIAETEEELAASLFLEIPPVGEEAEAAPARQGLDQWQKIVELEPKQRAAAVRPAQSALVHLSYRCFPSYRPLLIEYQKQLIRLSQGDEKAVGEALAELSQAREIMRAKSQRGRDYLDWFEITRARETSGVFDDYLKLKSQLKKRENARKDGMSLYLDQMQNLFERSKQK